VNIIIIAYDSTVTRSDDVEFSFDVKFTVLINSCVCTCTFKTLLKLITIIRKACLMLKNYL